MKNLYYKGYRIEHLARAHWNVYKGEDLTAVDTRSSLAEAKQLVDKILAGYYD